MRLSRTDWVAVGMIYVFCLATTAIGLAMGVLVAASLTGRWNLAAPWWVAPTLAAAATAVPWWKGEADRRE